MAASTSRRPLAVGLAVSGPRDPASFRALLALGVWAEGRGLHSVWVPEGHFRRGASSAPLLVLAALAARTQRVRLGTTSLLISIHDPLRLAAEVATLDLLSRGRVLLGLGRGFEPELFRSLGIDARAKRDRFDRALATMLETWRGARGSGATLAVPRPAQRPHPPLLVAAFGRKGLAQAARWGLPYLASPLESLSTLEANYAFHRSRLPVGANPDALGVPVLRTLHVAGNAAEARRVRTALGEEARRLAARARGSLARAADGPLEERVLVGEPAEVAAGLAAYRARLGIDLLIVRPPAATDDAARRASLERLLERVLPEVA